MTNKVFTPRFYFLAAMILLAAFSRIIPHPLNFSPLGAMGLFGAAYFSKKWQAFLVPLAATWLSDLFINNVLYGQYYPSFTWFYEGFYWQYGSYLLITLVGIFVFKKVNTGRVVIGALSSTAIFFLISNMGCWVGNIAYPQNFAGLTACYAAGIPFLKMTLIGDLFFAGLMFGTFMFAESKIRSLAEVKIRN